MSLEKLPFISFFLLTLILTGRILYLRKKQGEPDAKSNKKLVRNRWLAAIFLIITVLWIFELSRAALGFSLELLPDFLTNLLTNSHYLKGFGAVYIVLGLFGFVLTLIHFGTSLRFGLNKKKKGKLVTSGIFSLSRNPFFLSLECYFLGITFMLPSIFFIVFTLSAFISIHFVILKEERFLAENYGNEYLNYQQQTRRYF